MRSLRQPLWYRHAWWLPAAFTVAACVLVVAAVRLPSEPSALLTLSILGALPWSLLLLWLDFGPGFADRAALLVCLGLCANAALVWWSTAMLRARFRGKGQGSGD